MFTLCRGEHLKKAIFGWGEGGLTASLQNNEETTSPEPVPSGGDALSKTVCPNPWVGWQRDVTARLLERRRVKQ
jgi:hypothetical protein